MWPKDSLKSRKTKGCPPVLIREYRRHELRKVKRRGLDLAVIFDSGKTYFPRTWDGMRVCGRTLRVLGRIRNSYQFCTENIGWMLSIVKSLADVSLDRRSILAKHVHYQIDRINYQLWSMIECYSLDAKYAEAFARLKSQEELQALMYIGFSLVDPLKMATLKW